MFHFNVFDFHVHCGYAHNTYHPPADLEWLVAHLPRMKGCLCSSLSGIFDYRLGENDLQEIDKSNKIIGAYWVNPYHPYWQDNVIHFCRGKRVPCIKLSPTANIYEPTLQMLEPVWKFCDKQHKFIVIHTDPYRSSPEKLIPLLEKFPDVPVVLYHLNTGLINIHIAKMFSNVYLETSFCENTMDCMVIKHAMDVLGHDRILFGSDFPIGFNGLSSDKRSACYNSYTRKRFLRKKYIELIHIYYEDICEKDIKITEDILYTNAQKLLGKYHIKI